MAAAYSYPWYSAWALPTLSADQPSQLAWVVWLQASLMLAALKLPVIPSGTVAGTVTRAALSYLAPLVLLGAFVVIGLRGTSGLASRCADRFVTPRRRTSRATRPRISWRSHPAENPALTLDPAEPPDPTRFELHLELVQLRDEPGDEPTPSRPGVRERGDERLAQQLERSLGVHRILGCNGPLEVRSESDRVPSRRYIGVSPTGYPFIPPIVGRGRENPMSSSGAALPDAVLIV